MKRIILAFSALLFSCAVEPNIVPDRFDASIVETSSLSSSASSSASSSSSSSASSSSGGPLGDGSGTRLKRYVYTSADGLKHAVTSFYDSLLGTRCLVLESPIGTRCMPYDVIFGYVFVDAACTLHGVSVAKGCAAPTRAARTDTSSSTCAPATTFHVHVVGEPQPQGYYLSGNTCKAWTAVEMGLYDVYAVGPEVDYTQFAAMALEHE
jgi:hypothetical protein